MVRFGIWTLLFATGVFVGVVGVKLLSEREAEHPAAAQSPEAAVAAQFAPQEPAKPRAAPVAGSVAPAPVKSAAAPAGARSEPVAIAQTLPPIDSGTVVPIDMDERLRRHLAPKDGHLSDIAAAHEALEREPRDDSWAYTMEAELQNSMVVEVASGGFKVEGVDCRSTLCEVRLSGSGEQAAGVKRWNDSLMGQPLFGERLFLNYASTYSGHDRVDAIFIFRKPPPPAQR